MNRKNHNCILKCPQIEDQIQSFSKCPHILNGMDVAYTASYESIVGALSGEINIMSVFSKIEDKRNHKKNIVSYLGEEHARTLAHLGSSQLVQQIHLHLVIRSRFILS